MSSVRGWSSPSLSLLCIRWCTQNLQGVLSKLLQIHFPVSAEKLVSQPEEFWSKRFTLSRHLFLTTYPPWKVHKEKTSKMCLCSHFNVIMPSSSDKAAAIRASTIISVYLSIWSHWLQLMAASSYWSLSVVFQWSLEQPPHALLPLTSSYEKEANCLWNPLKIAFYWRSARWMS